MYCTRPKMLVAFIILAASSNALISRRQNGPVDDSTISDCTYFTSAAQGDTCSSIASFWGITEAQFIQYNPSVGSDCSGLIVGNSYCVEENYGMGPASTTTTKTTKTTAMPTTSTPAVPSPTQKGLEADCARFYAVKEGDYCAGIVNMYRTFTLDDFYSWNPAVHDDCSGLVAGYYVCVGVPGTPTSALPEPTPTGPQPTQSGLVDDCRDYYKVQSGDYCESIVDMYGTFSLADFYSWNPAIGSNCEHLFVDYYVCVGVSGTPTTRPSTTTASPTPTGPSPTQSGIVSDCSKYYQAMDGDSCAVIVDKFGTFSLSEFLRWNPAVQSDCSKLFLGYYYCTGTPDTATRQPEPSASPTPTPRGPQPQQSGIVENCNDFYLVKSGDYCYAIEQSQGISADDFFSWNTGLMKDCSNLLSGYYVCIGVS